MQTSFGEVLRRERKRRDKLSQSDLAEAIGVSQQTIANWENDRAVPEPERLLKLRQFFGPESPLNGIDPKGLADLEQRAPRTLLFAEQFELERQSQPQVMFSRRTPTEAEAPVEKIETVSYSERPRQAPAPQALEGTTASLVANVGADIARRLPQRLQNNVNRHIPIGTRDTRFFYLSERAAVALSVMQHDFGPSPLAARYLMNLLLLAKLHPASDRIAAIFLFDASATDHPRANRAVAMFTTEAEVLGVRVYRIRAFEQAVSLLIDLESNNNETDYDDLESY